MSYFVVGSMIFSALYSARTAQVQANANRAIANNNAQVAEQQAQDAERRGEDQAMRAIRQARTVASAQRAAFAARGLDMSTGTPADILEQTDFFGQVDAATARTNGRREAWADRVSRGNYAIKAALSDPNQAYQSSLLSSAPAVAGYWKRNGG